MKLMRALLKLYYILYIIYYIVVLCLRILIQNINKTVGNFGMMGFSLRPIAANVNKSNCNQLKYE